MRTYKFIGAEEILESIKDAEPDFQHVETLDPNTYKPYHGRWVTWIGNPGKMVKIPVENINFMPGNTWNFDHAAGLVQAMQSREGAFDAPAARVYRVTADLIKSTQKYDKLGQLQEQYNMTSPWTRLDLGQYYAVLLDGNHRAAAAMLAGEKFIYVYCGENYRENVRKKDLE